jgi:predicted phosphodiesterase
MKDIVTGVIPDLHIPGHVLHALEFVQDAFSDHKVTRIVCVGDIIDHHYISAFQSELDAMNPEQEWKASKKELKRWVDAFPIVYACIGNHDARPVRQAKTLGMPKDIFLKPLNEVYGLPSTWRWKTQWDIDSVIYEHGLGSNGMYGAKNTCIKYGSSYVQGHTHAYGAVFDIPQVRRRLSAMNVGALIDKDKYNARYAKNVYKVGMSLGCGIVFNESEMKFVPMR